MSAGNSQSRSGHNILRRLRRLCHVPVAVGPDRMTLAELRASFARGGPDMRAVATHLLAKSIIAREFNADAPALLAMARHPQTDAAFAGLIAATIAEAQAFQLVVDSTRAANGRGPSIELDKAALTPIVEVAEFAVQSDPDRAEARITLAVLRVFTDRPADARQLLIALDLADATPGSRANACGARALAEIELGQLAHARRIIHGPDANPHSGWVLPLAVAHLAVTEGDSGSVVS